MVKEEEFLFPFNGFQFTVSIILVYLLFVLKIGKIYMKNRSPYKLKKFIVAYNIFQIAACLLVIKAIWSDEKAPPSRYFSQCQVAEYMNKWSYLYKFNVGIYLLKCSEMLETIIFVLRKKWRQVSFLHVFHHCATLTLAFLAGYCGH
uniref:Elongation of very long chain fatty acids protein n=1 Tax=Megaselia scalaris TaxID=36166 RepID=T1GZ15_MEGSC